MIIFPWNQPIIFDGLTYFWYAIDITVLKSLPSYPISNDGWPIFLSFFFEVFPQNNAIDYMNLQRLVSVSLSLLTSIPIYFLCKNHFGYKFALIGVTLFLFNPHIIQNSILGITEPLYVLLGSITILLVLVINQKKIYLSFIIAGLVYFVRSDGIFVFFTIIIGYFVFNKINLKNLKNISIPIIIFLSIVFFISQLRNEIIGADYGISRLEGYTNNAVSSININFILDGIVNSIQFFGWFMIPVLISFVPIGVFFIFKDRKRFDLMLIIMSFVILIPAMYALTFKAFDTRYFIIGYPIFCLISINFIKKLDEKINYQNLLIISIISITVISSVIFLELKNFDNEDTYEAIRLSNQIVQNVKVINNYEPESQYIITSQIMSLKNFPISHSEFNSSVKMITINEDSLDKYMIKAKEEKLTHLVLDNGKDQRTRSEFFNEIFTEEKKYPFLKKIFDSNGSTKRYHMKIFEIDYSKLDLKNME
jgi:hypothetical protein